MKTKRGEVVFNKDGTITVNGYCGNRDNFEFIELSEYYRIFSMVQTRLTDLSIDLNKSSNELNYIKRLIRELL